MNTNSSNQKLNNKGFTLVELLVSLAISGMVIILVAMLMTTSSNLFKEENDKINLQNELQMVDNFVTKTVMEAKTLYIISNDDGDQTTYLYTGEKSVDDELEPVTQEEESTSAGEISTGDTTATITTERIISYLPGDRSLYILKEWTASPGKGSMISDNVSKFKVTIDDSCKTYEEVENGITGETTMEHKGYANPIVLNIELTVRDEGNGMEKNEVMTIKVRNNLEKVVVDGTEYTVK